MLKTALDRNKPFAPFSRTILRLESSFLHSLKTSHCLKHSFLTVIHVSMPL